MSLPYFLFHFSSNQASESDKYVAYCDINEYSQCSRVLTRYFCDRFEIRSQNFLSLSAHYLGSVCLFWAGIRMKFLPGIHCYYRTATWELSSIPFLFSIRGLLSREDCGMD